MKLRYMAILVLTIYGQTIIPIKLNLIEERINTANLDQLQQDLAEVKGVKGAKKEKAARLKNKIQARIDKLSAKPQVSIPSQPPAQPAPGTLLTGSDKERFINTRFKDLKHDYEMDNEPTLAQFKAFVDWVREKGDNVKHYNPKNPGEVQSYNMQKVDYCLLIAIACEYLRDPKNKAIMSEFQYSNFEQSLDESLKRVLFLLEYERVSMTKDGMLRFIDENLPVYMLRHFVLE